MEETELNIQYVARLARIALTPEEEERLGGQLGEILAYVEKLRELDVEAVEPTAHPITMSNITRSDEARPSLSNEEALRNAPAAKEGLFLTPKIVE